MKRCPTCQSRYENDSLRFCLQDGATLATVSDKPSRAGQGSTISMHEDEKGRSAGSPVTETLPPRAEAETPVISQTSSRIITLPNLLTMFRMVLIPVFVSLLFYQKFALALVVFLMAGITDGLDGLFARRFNQKSQLGTILDPIADKLLLVTSFIVLSLKQISPMPLPRHFPVPFWVTTAVISRDIFIIVGAAAINIVTGFRGFRPSWLGKVNTTVQILAIAAILIAAIFPAVSGYLPTVYTTVFALALFSGIHYVFFASKLLGEDRRHSDEN